jgi:hypothetical protein
MASLGSFLADYNDPIVWILSTIVFLGFMKLVFSLVRAVWKYFKRGIYDF